MAVIRKLAGPRFGLCALLVLMIALFFVVPPFVRAAEAPRRAALSPAFVTYMKALGFSSVRTVSESGHPSDTTLRR